MSQSLPVELWTSIASLINRSDLMNLALSSRLHLDIARRMFCQKITLDATRFRMFDDDEGVHELHNYIEKHNLHSVVQDLVVWGCAIKRALNKLLAVTPGLRSLSMIVAGRQVFLASASAQKRFLRHLKTSCPGLEVFRLNSVDHLKDGDFSIPNLKAVKWTEFGRVSPSFVSLCNASRLTLTEISLAIYDGAYAEFFRLSFPSLLCFKIGQGHELYGSNARRTKAVSSGLTAFLVAHPSIATLNLAYENIADVDSFMCISLRPKLLTEDMLPNLKTLHAHPRQVSQLATTNVKFLGSLETLSVMDIPCYNSDYWAAYNFSGMLDKLVTRGPLFVRRLVCVAPYEGSRAENFVSDMRKVADAFPKLEVWVGSSPGYHPIEQLAEIFSQLPNIKEISYDFLFAICASEDYTTDHVRVLAERCPLLESFVWRDTRPLTQFRITRLNDQTVIDSSPLVHYEEKNRHADSDTDKHEVPWEDERWPEGDDGGDDDDKQEGDENNSGAESGGVDDNDHDMSGDGGSDKEGVEDSGDED